jgi:Holliday junction resolvase-like predicted endonuclease
VSPFASVTARKRAKLRAIARYLAKQNGWPINRVRVDAVAVEFRREANGSLKAIDVRIAHGVA